MAKSKAPSHLHSLEERVQAWEDAGRMCHYCDRPLPRPGTKSGRRTNFDHKTAQSKGGSDDLEDLIVCCKMCNFEKGKKDYHEYLLHRKAQLVTHLNRLNRLIRMHNHA